VQSIKPKWRIIDSGIVSAEFSTAADEVILNARIRDIIPDTLHFYVRECPTISVGYNQPVKESVYLDETEKRGVRIVRRFSGGSAIYTDTGQLIFALVIDRSFVYSDIVRSYEKICSAIIRGLSKLGIRADYKPVNDIVVDGFKISGSAQFRRGDIVLHHGTILVDTDLESITMFLRPPKKKDSSPIHGRLTSLNRLLGFSPDMGDVKRAIIEGIAETFGVTLYSGALTQVELSEIDRLIREKYGTREWNWRL